MRTRRLLVLPSMLLLAACAVVNPAAPATPSAPLATASGTPTPSVTATPTQTVTSASPSVTPSQDTAAKLVLRGDGLGTFDFGAKQAPVAELLSDQLGDPDEASQGILCELDDSSPWAETQSYGGLWVQFVAKDKQKSSPRTLAAWGFALAEDFASPLQMADEVPLALNFKELKAKYPKGKLEDIGFGDGSAMFTLPNKMRFIGVDEPDTVQAGQLTFCE